MPNSQETRLSGIEVKGHGRPLSSNEIDGLILKLQDTEGVQERGIISSSGFAGPALTSCNYHGITAYSLRDWDTQCNYFGVCLKELRNFDTQYFEWLDPARVQIEIDMDVRRASRGGPCLGDGTLRDNVRSFNELCTLIGQICGGFTSKRSSRRDQEGVPHATGHSDGGRRLIFVGR